MMINSLLGQEIGCRSRKERRLRGANSIESEQNCRGQQKRRIVEVQTKIDNQRANTSTTTATRKPLGNPKSAPKTNNRTMQINLTRLLAASALIIIVIQTFVAFNSSEAKKIKLKDLKKAKKYAYLLAPQSKKFYAVPFPFPLPVFVKRQHIYTQVPVVPRYVQKQPAESHPNYGAESNADFYSDSSSELQIPPAYGPSKQHTSYSPHPTKYLMQFAANALGNSYPILGSGVQRDVVGKLLSGQARVFSPSALISTLRQQQYNQSPPMRQRPEQDKYNKQSSDDNNGSGASGSTNSSSKAESAAVNKGSASELYMATLRSPSPLDYSAPGELYRLEASNMLPFAPYLPAHARHPSAAMIAAAQLPLLQAQMANELMAQMVDPQLVGEASSPVEAHAAAHQQQQPEEMSPEYEAALMSKQRQLQHPKMQLEQDLLQRVRRERQHQQALRAALVREKEVARLAESNPLAITAHQLGYSVIPNRLRLLNY